MRHVRQGVEASCIDYTAAQGQDNCNKPTGQALCVRKGKEMPGKLVVLRSADDARRECIQLIAEQRLSALKEAMGEPNKERESEVAKQIEEMAEGEKITELKPDDDWNKEIDKIEWKARHDPDKKLISIPGPKKLKGGLY